MSGGVDPTPSEIELVEAERHAQRPTTHRSGQDVDRRCHAVFTPRVLSPAADDRWRTYRAFRAPDKKSVAAVRDVDTAVPKAESGTVVPQLPQAARTSFCRDPSRRAWDGLASLGLVVVGCEEWPYRATGSRRERS